MSRAFTSGKANNGLLLTSETIIIRVMYVTPKTAPRR